MEENKMFLSEINKYGDYIVVENDGQTVIVENNCYVLLVNENGDA